MSPYEEVKGQLFANIDKAIELEDWLLQLREEGFKPQTVEERLVVTFINDAAAEFQRKMVNITHLAGSNDETLASAFTEALAYHRVQFSQQLRLVYCLLERYWNALDTAPLEVPIPAPTEVPRVLYTGVVVYPDTQVR